MAHARSKEGWWPFSSRKAWPQAEQGLLDSYFGKRATALDEVFMTYTTRCECDQKISRRPTDTDVYVHHFTGHNNGMDMAGRPWERPHLAPRCSSWLYRAWGAALERANRSAAGCSLY